VLERLAKDMKRVGRLPEPIFPCFTCDPYCIDAPEGITREAIRIIVESGNSVNILTKGGRRAEADFDLLVWASSRIGATLTFVNEDLSREWEPNAAPPEERVHMLWAARLAHIETWASIEPVIIPEQSLKIMELAAPYVDIFKIGKWNHDKRANDIDWAGFVEDAVSLCDRYGKKYVLKQDLMKYRKEKPV
jgi:DNA repair photolyase